MECLLCLVLWLIPQEKENNSALTHADEVIKILKVLSTDETGKKQSLIWEALGDAYMVKAALMPRGEERKKVAKQGDRIFSQMAARLNFREFDEELLRLLWKHARYLREYDPDGLKRFFENFDMRGYAPKWDLDKDGKSRWGYRDKMEALRPK